MKPLTEPMTKRLQKVVAKFEILKLEAAKVLVAAGAEECKDWIPKALLEKGIGLSQKLEQASASGTQMLSDAQTSKNKWNAFLAVAKEVDGALDTIMDKLNDMVEQASKEAK